MSNQGFSDYDSAFEWPGVEPQNWSARQPAANPPERSCLRLVVQSSDVLSKRLKVAVLDAYDEVQIGRDVSRDETVPRIRLKDMEVSKLHATVFWDREREEWAIVDMASKHGTFVRPALVPPQQQSQPSAEGDKPAGAFVRLSPPKQASMPRTLHHADSLTIGRSIFEVHVHHSGVPCDVCTSEGTHDIPLFASTSSSSKAQEKDQIKAPQSVPVSPVGTLDSKSALSLLKKSLLSRHSSDASKRSDNSTTGTPSKYIDRSAKRRAFHPYLHPDSVPGVPSRHAPGSEFKPLRLPSARSPTDPPFRSSSVPPDQVTSSSISSNGGTPPPISDLNIGHKLLSKQGWKPGNSLGLSSLSQDDAAEERVALVEPIKATANVGRMGLGMRASSDTCRPVSMSYGGDWKEEMKRRRWTELQGLR